MNAIVEALSEILGSRLSVDHLRLPKDDPTRRHRDVRHQNRRQHIAFQVAVVPQHARSRRRERSRTDVSPSAVSSR